MCECARPRMGLNFVDVDTAMDYIGDENDAKYLFKGKFSVFMDVRIVIICCNKSIDGLFASN